MRKKVNEIVVSGEAWASAAEKLWTYRWEIVSALAWLVGLSGLGTWFASQWNALAPQGWGVYPLVGLGFALSATALVAMFVWIAKNWSRKKTQETVPITNSLLDALPTKEVFRRHYRNETVVVDGITFFHCLFENVTFRWEGGRFSLKDCTIRGNSEVLSGNRIVKQAISFMLSLGMQRAERIERAYYSADDIDPGTGALVRVVDNKPPEGERSGGH